MACSARVLTDDEYFFFSSSTPLKNRVPAMGQARYVWQSAAVHSTREKGRWARNSSSKWKVRANKPLSCYVVGVASHCLLPRQPPLPQLRSHNAFLCRGGIHDSALPPTGA